MKINKLLKILTTAISTLVPVATLVACGNPNDNTNITFDDSQKKTKELKSGEIAAYKIYLNTDKYNKNDIEIKLLLPVSNSQEELVDVKATWTVDGKLLTVYVEHTSKSYSEKTITFNIQIKSPQWTETIKNCSLKFPEELINDEALFDTTFVNFRQYFLNNFETYKTYNYFDVKEGDYWVIRGTTTGGYYANGEIKIQDSDYFYWPKDQMGFNPIGISNELYHYDTVNGLKSRINEEIKEYGCTVKYFASAHELRYEYLSSENKVLRRRSYSNEGHLIEYYDCVTESVMENRNIYVHPSNFCKK